ncbi:MAG TPA: hypothetical protein VH877_02260 [Polyangia bacterium]|jgi:hypothetical protein|nr:hypothetical protein [Polyangia bacterium]
MNPPSPLPVRHRPLSLLAFSLLLSVTGGCPSISSCAQSGGTIPPSKFQFQPLPGTAAGTQPVQVACITIEFRHIGPPPVGWHCDTEIELPVAGTTGPARLDEARAATAAATDFAARHLMSLGLPESAPSACQRFYTVLREQLGTSVSGARVGPFDACTRHHLPSTHFP